MIKITIGKSGQSDAAVRKSCQAPMCQKWSQIKGILDVLEKQCIRMHTYYQPPSSRGISFCSHWNTIELHVPMKRREQAQRIGSNSLPNTTAKNYISRFFCYPGPKFVLSIFFSQLLKRNLRLIVDENTRETLDKKLILTHPSSSSLYIKTIFCKAEIDLKKSTGK